MYVCCNFAEYIVRDSFAVGTFVSKLVDVENWGFALDIMRVQHFSRRVKSGPIIFVPDVAFKNFSLLCITFNFYCVTSTKQSETACRFRNFL